MITPFLTIKIEGIVIEHNTDHLIKRDTHTETPW